ncbi:MAG: hypothetical protein KGI70_02775 [Patescibacteria group bacterium]|nr:hypothetical protein [Patescibacteria group bacterium]
MTKPLSFLASLLVVLGFLAPALALAEGLGVYATARIDITDHASSTAAARADIRAHAEAKSEANAKDRANKEIDRRIAGLNKEINRINDAPRVDATAKANITATINTQIQALTDLKAKIAADSSTTTLKADVQSITRNYRIFALVMPQAAIAASASRVNTVADSMTTLYTKLQNRAATSTNTSVTGALSDMQAKIADARTQAAAAVTLTASLRPDNGDNMVFESNQIALKTARADLRVAQQDFVAARKDVEVILKALNIRGKEKAELHATSTAEVH